VGVSVGVSDGVSVGVADGLGLDWSPAFDEHPATNNNEAAASSPTVTFKAKLRTRQD